MHDCDYNYEYDTFAQDTAAARTKSPLPGPYQMQKCLGLGGRNL